MSPVNYPQTVHGDSLKLYNYQFTGRDSQGNKLELSLNVHLMNSDIFAYFFAQLFLLSVQKALPIYQSPLLKVCPIYSDKRIPKQLKL